MSEISFNEQKPDVPVIIIERDDDEQQKGVIGAKPLSRRARWLRRLLLLATILAVAVGVLAAYHLWRYYYRIGVPVSTTPSENIAKLKAPLVNETPEVVMTSDSILGVALDLYAIHGLQASLSLEEPDTADTSVYLYCRSADHKVDETYLGSLVVEGEEKAADRSRLGYMAMADGRMVIGVSRSEKVKDYVASRGGSFFRQFILVSDGVIPSRFYLHGKVERRAIGRIDDTLYYIATRNKETLWDFADALREYGFIDAIYITGGTDYCFYRSADGQLHDIGDVADYPHTKWQGVIPWLVFRKME
ncbi:MAG: hypothetical protein IJV24_04405 [Prevotella sp.]|nr:hypothetical protein [Prevotella sp.]